jgi:predicted dehydrogenase
VKEQGNMTKKRYAQVGTGGRARFFYEALATQFVATAELVGFCDVNQTRMDFANHVLQEHGVKPVNTYKPDEFQTMIRNEKPDIIIVTSIDRTHHHYIIQALEAGCDVITEKPMTIDAVKAQAILEAIKRTGHQVRVAFNYRYAPHHTKIRELIAGGVIGEVFSVHFEWLLNIEHGADYFRRWHRDKRNSGGLLVHKATHHFDLVNFWLGTQPKTVFAMGDLRFYGRENAEKRGITKFYSRTRGSANAIGDPFALNLESSEKLQKLYLEAEHEDGYYRDQSVFGDGISIEDVMGVMVRYQNNAILTYSLNAYMPWEGFRIGFNGSKGRIQFFAVERSYVNSGGSAALEGAVKEKSIIVYPMFGEPYQVPLEETTGGHGGGDPVQLNDLFGEPEPDPYNRAASHVDGLMSILTGIAANQSMATGMPVNIAELIRF